jgi:hypothetical protein
MALNDIKGTAIPDPSRPGYYDFSLNGISTAKQMDKLIDLTSAMAKRLVKGKDTPEGKAELDRIDAIKASNKETTKASKQTKELSDATEDLRFGFDNLSRVAHGSFKGLSDLSYFLSHNSKLALGLTGFGTMLGALNGYADNLGKAMQMGVAGDIMTFAIASKTAGVRLESFTSALKETGGGFASLGTSATDGAVKFGALVSEVRSSTERFGNLGLSLDDLAMFTAQQVKVAVSQGFKGKQAQEQVRANSVALAKDLQNLSESTGKSVTELAAAANKLATDPLIATMVATTRENRKQVSSAVLGFAASIRGVFGEAGDVLGTDALKSAAAGLPLALTESGKNLLIASAPLYNEFTKLAEGVQQGRQVTEQDRDRLRKLAEQEVEQRGQQIKTLSMLEGPAGESARQLLKLAEEARFYNTEEGKERKKQLDSSRRFVAERNKLEANLQQALIPVLGILNNINWNFFYGILNGVAAVFNTILKVLNPIANLLGATGAGSLLGGLLALAGVVGIAGAAFTAFTSLFGSAKALLGGNAAGGFASMFGRRANGQTAATPLWVRTVDNVLNGGRGTSPGMTPEQQAKYKDLRRQGLSPAEARAQASRGGMFAGLTGMSTAAKIGMGGMALGGILGSVGSGMEGDAGKVVELLGAGVDIATIMSMYKAYGKTGMASILRATGYRGAGSAALMRLGPRIMAGGAGALVGGTVANAVMGPAQTNAGTAGNIAGSIAGGVGGSFAGRFLGGMLGTWAGPVGIAIGSAAGGVIGQLLGDKLFGDDVTDTAVSANDTIYSDNEKRVAETARLNASVTELVDQQRAANSMNAQALNYQRDTSRNIKNLPLPN